MLKFVKFADFALKYYFYRFHPEITALDTWSIVFLCSASGLGVGVGVGMGMGWLNPKDS